MGEFSTNGKSSGAEATRLQPTNVRWRVVALLMAYAALNHFNRVSMSVAGTERILVDYEGGISETQMGMVYSAFLVAYTAAMTPGGWVIDRVGARLALVGMGFGSAAFVVLTGLAGLQWQDAAALLTALVVIRALAGVCSAPIHPAASRVVSRWIPLPSRSWANGLVNGAALIGIASTYYVVGPIMDFGGWQLPFLLAGAVTAGVAFLWAWYATEMPAVHPSVNEEELTLIVAASAESGPPRNGWDAGEVRQWSWVDSAPPLRALISRTSLLNSRSLLVLTLSYVAIGYFEFMLFYWIEHYFFKALEFSKSDSRLYSTACNLAMGCGMFVGGGLSDLCVRLFGHRRGRAAVPVTAMLGGALFLGLGVVSKAQPLVVVLYFAIAMAAAGACEGPFWTTAVELGGRRGGTSAGLFNTGGNVGGFIAPILTPYLSQFIGWEGALGVAGVLCVLGAVAWYWVDPAERVPEPA